MRSQALVLVVLMCLSILPAEINVQNDADSLSSEDKNKSWSLVLSPEENVISTYSQSIQSSLARVSDLSQYPDELLSNVSSWVAISRTPVGLSLPQLEGAWLMELGTDSLSIVEEMLEESLIEAAYPLVERQQTPRWIPNDPKFSDQWHLENTGQSGGTVGEDANLTGAWNNYQGSGVIIGIVDDGLDWNHPDLDDYYQSTLDYDFCGDDGNPTPSSNNAHGTAAAGVAAAVGNNSLGVSGAAPQAGLAGLQLISCSTTDIRESNALGHENQMIDIYSNSWGPSDNGETLEGPGPLMLAAMEASYKNGRGGLGNIITWAAGNGLGNDDNSNNDGYANLRYVIAVTAVTYKGEQSYYAEPGANILVAAPSNGDGESITTTDIEGADGYTSSDYTDSFGGTSSATPLVSGVIALMLEANPNLTWRDVQHVLVETSRKNDASDSSWTTNGDGYLVSHKYGFGVVDASAAVNLAAQWSLVESEMNISTGMQTVNLEIPDNSGSPVNLSANITEPLHLESIDVYVDIDHTFRGDVELILTAPSGMKSILTEKHSDANNNYADWRFSTVQHWGEDSRGEWILSAEDKGNGDVGTINEWGMILYGTDRDVDSDGDLLTDRNETEVYFTDPHDADSDDDQLNDGYEVMLSATDPNLADTDGDGLDDGIEILVNLTDPLDFDSDDDLLSDGVEVLINGTNPLVKDTDGDGLNDGVEVLVNLTDPLRPDTDSDGLSDGAEVLQYQSNPLVYDPNSDQDGYYWFNDCNDSNPLIFPGAIEKLNGIDDNCDGFWDEGFNQTDTDGDNLSDYEEYHIYGTNISLSDTDGDLLRDDAELFIYQTDPLIADNDSDVDGYYWFEDCDDEDPLRNPSIIESLDGIDNNCNNLIDEAFFSTDADNDSLLDYDEFTNLSTDPFDSDSDDDGLSDGEEVLITMTDPLVADLDNDGDGYRWFEECDDTRFETAPNRSEQWNGRDDNCDGFIDEDVDRQQHIARSPSNTSIVLNATADSLFLEVELNLTVEQMEELNISYIWWRNGQIISTNKTLFEGPYDCQKDNLSLAIEICSYNGLSAPYEIIVFVEDGRKSVSMNWSIVYDVYHPEVENGFFKLLDSNTIVSITLGLIIALLLAILIARRGKQKPPNSPSEIHSNLQNNSGELKELEQRYNEILKAHSIIKRMRWFTFVFGPVAILWDDVIAPFIVKQGAPEFLSMEDFFQAIIFSFGIISEVTFERYWPYLNNACVVLFIVFLYWSIQKKREVNNAAEEVSELEGGVVSDIMQKAYAEVIPAPELESFR